MPKILIVDDNEDILQAVKLLLKPFASVIITEKDPNKIYSILQDQSFDVIFLDMNYSKDTTSGQEGFFWLKEIIKLDFKAVVVLITAYGDVATAVRAIKEGATDFVLKPWQNEKLIATFNAALKLRESRDELERMKTKQSYINQISGDGLNQIIGISEPMQKVFKTIQKVADTDANVLILGENGTGKELVARALHKQSKRAKEIFVSVDIGSLTQTLFESELFGYVKGAFTDAKEDRAGRFELASDGTLFLDEIGNLPLEMQSKLLTVIQNKEVFRVGSSKPVSIDSRLVCATNVPIYEQVAANKFRQDLLYRINTVEIHLPSLRERKGDIPLLTEHYLSLYKRKYNKPELVIDSATQKYFENYEWPGNIRELQHAIERSVILCDSHTLKFSDISLLPNSSCGNEDSFNTMNLEEIEKQIIQKALLKFDGNVSKAAKELGLTRTSLYRRMEKHGL
ncbi:MAG: sigma-54 dependent transcriptional regulator [Ignavibacteriaceae bacterium]